MRKLPVSLHHRVAEEIDKLAVNPLSRGVKKLVGGKGVYRVRVGDYRIVHSVDFGNRLVIVERIGHRKETYR
jgi:mRNA interferase RelE/StbE